MRFANENVEDGVRGRICKSELDFVARWISSPVGIRRRGLSPKESSLQKKEMREELLNVIKQFVLLLSLFFFLMSFCHCHCHCPVILVVEVWLGHVVVWV